MPAPNVDKMAERNLILYSDASIRSDYLYSKLHDAGWSITRVYSAADEPAVVVNGVHISKVDRIFSLLLGGHSEARETEEKVRTGRRSTRQLAHR